MTEYIVGYEATITSEVTIEADSFEEAETKALALKSIKLLNGVVCVHNHTVEWIDLKDSPAEMEE